MRPPLISRNMANPNYDKRIEILSGDNQNANFRKFDVEFGGSTRTVDIINIRR